MCTAAAQVDAEGRILRVAGISCAPGEGTPAFDVYYREMAIWKRLGADRIDVALDGADGYKQRLSGLALPPAYRVA